MIPFNILFLNIYHKYMENEKMKACIKIVISQTNYTDQEAFEKLKKWDNDFIKVIKEYLNPDFQIKKKEKKKSLNQAVIGEIRKFKDKQCFNYIKEKNNEYEINKLLYLNSLTKVGDTKACDTKACDTKACDTDQVEVVEAEKIIIDI